MKTQMMAMFVPPHVMKKFQKMMSQTVGDSNLPKKIEQEILRRKRVIVKKLLYQYKDQDTDYYEDDCCFSD